MLSQEEISRIKTKLITKKDMEEFKIEFKKTLDKCKDEIITEIRKIRKIVSKWK